MSYQRRLSLDQFNSRKGPHARLKRLIGKKKDIASYAARMLAVEIQRVAREFLSGDREPYGGWAPLWEESREYGKWTPEWNERSRYNPEKRGDDHPLYDTGTLHDSIEIERIGTGVYKIGSKEPHAAMHEFGGPNPLPNHKDIPARPYLTPAFIFTEEDNTFKRYFNRKINKLITKKYVEPILRG